jgi:hypothetical protein
MQFLILQVLQVLFHSQCQIMLHTHIIALALSSGQVTIMTTVPSHILLIFTCVSILVHKLGLNILQLYKVIHMGQWITIFPHWQVFGLLM